MYVSEQLNSWFSFYFPAHFIYRYFATLLCITSIMTFLGIQSSYSFLLTLHNRVLKGKTIHIRKMRLYSKTMKLHQCFTTRHLVCILELLVGYCMNDLFGVLNIREIQNNGWVGTAICIIVREERKGPAHEMFKRSILQSIPDDWLSDWLGTDWVLSRRKGLEMTHWFGFG